MARFRQEQKNGEGEVMSQIEELQTRILTAMDRISAGVESASSIAAAAPQEPDAELTQALEEEKLANAQLEERLRALKERHAAELSEAQSADANAGSEALSSKEEELAVVREQLSNQASQLEDLDAELGRLREANKQLRDANDALRKANEEGVGDPSLINKAMLAELEGLRATQAADAAEMNVVMDRLNTLLSNANNLPEGEEA